ncbi:hypothetical protein LCGC14_1113270 [marine sediment metagenome]|uniref:Uncharacterized protein n=1 Tax=marine sediment metagenome TaxID=412755 RepID=A0A0F9PP97_9ZZZZ
MGVSLSLTRLLMLIAESATKFETLIGYPDMDEVLFIFDPTLDPSWDPENSVGSIRIDWSLDTYICNFGEDEMFFTDPMDCIFWILGKEIE